MCAGEIIIQRAAQCVLVQILHHPDSIVLRRLINTVNQTASSGSNRPFAEKWVFVGFSRAAPHCWMKTSFERAKPTNTIGGA